jgi:hypothetical protein
MGNAYNQLGSLAPCYLYSLVVVTNSSISNRYFTNFICKPNANKKSGDESSLLFSANDLLALDLSRWIIVLES